jgi:hypothetical protein
MALFPEIAATPAASLRARFPASTSISVKASEKRPTSCGFTSQGQGSAEP